VSVYIYIYSLFFLTTYSNSYFLLNVFEKCIVLNIVIEIA